MNKLAVVFIAAMVTPVLAASLLPGLGQAQPERLPAFMKSPFGSVQQMAHQGERVTFNLSVNLGVQACPQVSYFADSLGPKRNLPIVRLDQARQSGRVASVVYMLNEATCIAYVIDVEVAS